MSGETLESADIREILRLLPHRYPFVMIDRIIDIRGEDHGVGIKNVTFNEPHFLGHFPDNPVMPGVLLIEGMAQTAGVLCLRQMNEATRKSAVFYFLTIDNAKFRKPAVRRRYRHRRRDQDRQSRANRTQRFDRPAVPDRLASRHIGQRDGRRFRRLGRAGGRC